MTEHTPGPWRIMSGKPTKTRGIDVFSESYNGKIVASCWFSHLHVYKGEPEARARADARLIAAAPDLLHELRTSVCPGGGYTGQPENEEPTVENCLKAHNCGCTAGAAVRKATGVS